MLRRGIVKLFYFLLMILLSIQLSGLFAQGGTDFTQNQSASKKIEKNSKNNEIKILNKLMKKATVTASYHFPSDKPAACNDGVIPKNSSDTKIKRCTFHPKVGTTETITITFHKWVELGQIGIYWFDNNDNARIPKYWRVYAYQGVSRKKLKSRVIRDVKKDRFDVYKFEKTLFGVSRLEIEITLQPEKTGGILEIQVGR